MANDYRESSVKSVGPCLHGLMVDDVIRCYDDVKP